MQCPRCQSENQEAANFCEECGTPLMQACPHCGCEVSLRARFCSECGQRLSVVSSPTRFTSPLSYTPKHLADRILTARSALHGERKSVTILFADVAGFSTLADRLEPEDVHTLMDGCFAILTQQVHAYEGTINQFQAAPHFETSIATLHAIHAENELALAYAGYGRWHAQHGDMAQARDYLTRALAIFERLGTLGEPDKVRQALAALPAR